MISKESIGYMLVHLVALFVLCILMCASFLWNSWWAMDIYNWTIAWVFNMEDISFKQTVLLYVGIKFFLDRYRKKSANIQKKEDFQSLLFYTIFFSPIAWCVAYLFTECL